MFLTKREDRALRLRLLVASGVGFAALVTRTQAKDLLSGGIHGSSPFLEELRRQAMAEFVESVLQVPALPQHT